MKTFSWTRGTLTEGLKLTPDEKMGQVVYLGESGRGRRYEKVGLSRRNPAQVTANGRVLEAELQPITIPARDGKPALKFWVLARPSGESEKVIVRLDTEGTYTRKTSGRWEVISGQPEKVIEGWGVYGIAGGLGGWTDGLVIFQPGDVVKVSMSGGRKFEPYALWYGEDGLQTATWQDYENIQALKKANKVLEAAQGSGPESLRFHSGQLQAYTWSHGRVKEGIELSNGATGKVVSLGQSGRGRTLLELPLVGIETKERLTEAAVVILEEKVIPARYSGESETVRRKYAFAQGQPEQGFLVKVSTSWVYTRASGPEIAAWKGKPEIFAEGRGAHGAAGAIYSWPEVMVILHEGDVLFVRPEGGSKTDPYALFVNNGKLGTEPWISWKIKDAKSDPDFYVAKGTAPEGHVPEEWVGKVVSIVSLEHGRDRGDYLEDRETGELVSVSPLVLNLGWDGTERHEIKPHSVTWVKLTDRQVRKLEGAELEQRQSLRREADALKAKAEAILETRLYDLAEQELRDRLYEVAKTYSSKLDTLPTEGSWGTLANWVEDAQQVLSEYAAVETVLRELEERKSRGEILVDFGGHFRRMGASGQEDRWVIKPNGTLRNPDQIEYRKRYTEEGDKSWRIVEAEELALAWFGGLSARVEKLPIGGCTPEQLDAVAAIERDLEIPENSFGLNTAKGEEYARKLAVIVEACKQSRVLRKLPELEYLTVIGEDGQYVEAEFVRGSAKELVNWANEFDTPICNRMGQVVETIATEDGTVEFIAYEKYGTTNLNVRWRSK